VTQPSKTARWY